MRKLSATFFVFLLTGIAGLECQTPAPPAEKLTFQKLISATKTTLRDSAELPMVMRVSLVASDTSGRVRKQKSDSYEYNFHGFNPKSSHTSASLRGGRGTMNAARNSSLFFVGPVFVLDPAVTDHYTFDITEANETNPYIRLKARPTTSPCGQFDWNIGYQAPNAFCARRIDMDFETGDLSLHRYVFEYAGLPIQTRVEPFGRSTLLGYRMEVELQPALLPGDPKPFLIPKHSVTTIETSKGIVVIDTAYALRNKK